MVPIGVGTIRAVFEELEAAERPGNDKIDCLLLDMVLPNGDGLEPFLRIRERFPHLPVVIITGHDHDGLEAEVIGMGAKAFIRKPPKATLLVETLVRAMKKKEVLDRPLHKEWEKATKDLEDSVYPYQSTRR